MENGWASESLLKWASGALHQAALWLQPPGTKSLTLAPYLKDGPVLFLFTPRNPFHKHNYYYNLVNLIFSQILIRFFCTQNDSSTFFQIKEIGLQYYNCGDNLLIDDIVNRLEYIRLRDKAVHYEKSKRCMQLSDKIKNQQTVHRISVSDQQWINESCCARIMTNKCSVCKKTIVLSLENEEAVCSANLNNVDNSCKQKDVFKVPSDGEEEDRYEFCCDDSTINELETSLLQEENDPQSANAINDFHAKDECRRLLTGNNYHPPVFPKKLTHDSQKVNLTSYICRTNKTLALIAVDSLEFFHIAEGLGIDILKKKDKTAVAILDPVVSRPKKLFK